MGSSSENRQRQLRRPPQTPQLRSKHRFLHTNHIGPPQDRLPRYSRHVNRVTATSRKIINNMSRHRSWANCFRSSLPRRPRSPRFSVVRIRPAVAAGLSVLPRVHFGQLPHPSALAAASAPIASVWRFSSGIHIGGSHWIIDRTRYYDLVHERDDRMVLAPCYCDPITAPALVRRAPAPTRDDGAARHSRTAPSPAPVSSAPPVRQPCQPHRHLDLAHRRPPPITAPVRSTLL